VLTESPRLDRMRIIDLSHPLWEKTPYSPNAPGFRRTLLRRHGDVTLDEDVSFASDLLVTGTHVGTHMDALSHISCEMRLHGGHDAEAAQRGGTFSVHGIEDFQSFVSRAVLFDIPRIRGVEVLDAADAITPDDLQACVERDGFDVEPGDVALIRSGWSRHVADTEKFVGLRDGVPGINLDAAKWLSTRDVRAVGGETIALEQIPPHVGHARMPVHRHLIVEKGVTIIEVMRLDDLAAAGAVESIIVLAPLPLVGATGSPVRPLALIPQDT
jgi:kynurenine formamidase